MSAPAVLVTATRFDAGLSDDLRRVPVSEIAESVDATPGDAFPPAAAADIPLPRPRIALKTPNVPIEEVCETLATAAQSHRLPIPFFIRLIWQESRFDPRAVSPVGAQGVAQFMPQTAAAMGLKNPFDPLQALEFSARLLRELLGTFGNLGLAAAAYNAGPKRIFDWLAKRGELPEETRNYVKSITGHPAEDWRVTRPGRLRLSVPKRAPCQGVEHFAQVVQVPAPVPVPRPRARAQLLAKDESGERKQSTPIPRRSPVDLSAARKKHKARAAAKPNPVAARAKADGKRKAKKGSGKS